MDLNKRTAAKTISWRLFAIILLLAITYSATRSIKFTTVVTMCYHIIQMVMYYLHEKLWNMIKWGKSKGVFIQMTGLSGAGKSTLAFAVGEKLRQKGYKIEIIDGDEYREGLCKDLGFSKEDRNTNIRRLGFVGKVLSRNGVITIMSAINPYQEVRQELENKCGAKTVFIQCSLETCIERDVKGLYAKALSGEIQNFTGVSDPFEEPKDCDLIINTANQSLDQSAALLEKYIISQL
jgi:adenylylsulfate kinase